MDIRYRTSTLTLEDLPLDIGYASERVELKNAVGEKFRIGGQDGSTQLIVTVPFVNDALLSELNELTSLLAINALGGVNKVLAVANDQYELPLIDGWQVGFDYDEALGDYYGIRLGSGEMGGEFAKAFFIISKDGALFFSDISNDLDAPIDIAKAIVKIAAADNCYTGKGCH